jgi:hypothetical protein
MTMTTVRFLSLFVPSSLEFEIPKNPGESDHRFSKGFSWVLWERGEIQVLNERWRGSNLRLLTCEATV